VRLIKRGHIASRSSGLVRRGKLSKTVMSRKLLRVCRQMPSVRNRLRWASKAPIPTCRLPLARRRRISNISRQTTRTAGITGRHTSTKTQTLKAGRRISTTLLAVRLTRLGFRIRKGAGNVLAQLGNLLRRDRLDGYSSRCLGRVGVKTAPIKAPTHPIAAHVAPSLPDNSATPASRLLSVAAVIAKIKSNAPILQGVLSGSRLIPFSTFNPESPVGARTDGIIAAGRQVWELTYAFPSGVTMRIGRLGSDAKAIVAIDAATGNFLAAKWTGSVISTVGGKRH